MPKNTLVAGTAKVQGERLDILVSSIEYAGNIIPVELAVFDTDGQKGLSVPSSMEQEAFNEAMANIGSGLGTSISFAQSAGQQVAMDVTRGLLQRNVRLPRQEVPNRESKAESRVQGDALRQTTITILSTTKILIDDETDFWIVRPLAGRVCGKRTNN